MNIIDVKLNFKPLKSRHQINQIILHHAAKNNCTIEDIHRWHLNDNGWSGIGYHYFVRKNGDIYIGRPEDKVGSHCKGHNLTSIGICAEGNFMFEKMNFKQYEAIQDLCNYLKNKYYITDILFHNDLSMTKCPGINYPNSLKFRNYF